MFMFCFCLFLCFFFGKNIPIIYGLIIMMPQLEDNDFEWEYEHGGF